MITLLLACVIHVTYGDGADEPEYPGENGTLIHCFSFIVGASFV
jgi:hypothetical protein